MNYDSPSMNALAAPPMSAPSMAPSAPKKKSAPKEKDDNRGEVRGMRIEPAENGFMVCTSFEPKKVNPKMDRYSQMPEDEEMVFDNADDMFGYLKSKLDAVQQDEAAGE